jgi:hypothetical protein
MSPTEDGKCSFRHYLLDCLVHIIFQRHGSIAIVVSKWTSWIFGYARGLRRSIRMTAEPFSTVETCSYCIIVINVNIADMNDLQRLSPLTKVSLVMLLPRLGFREIERIWGNGRVRAESKDREAEYLRSTRRNLHLGESKDKCRSFHWHEAFTYVRRLFLL